MEMANMILAQIREAKSHKKPSAMFGSANLADRTFRPAPGSGKVPRKELPPAQGGRVPSFIDDADRREEINVQAQNLYAEQQKAQQVLNRVGTRMLTDRLNRLQNNMRRLRLFQLLRDLVSRSRCRRRDLQSAKVNSILKCDSSEMTKSHYLCPAREAKQVPLQQQP